MWLSPNSEAGFKNKISSVNSEIVCIIYYIDTDEIPGFFLLLNNHTFMARSKYTIFIFYM